MPRFLKAALHAVIALTLAFGVVATTAHVSAGNAEAHQGNIKVTDTACVDSNTMKATYTAGWTNGTASGVLYTKIGLYGGTGDTSGWVKEKDISGASGSATFTKNHSFSGSNGPWVAFRIVFSDGYIVGGDTRVEGWNWTGCLSKDAAADVKAHSPTCTADGYAELVGLQHATQVGKLDLTVGKHTATFKSDEGHLFADGKDVKTVDYTIAGQLTGQQCWANDATASVDVTAPTCTANGSAAVVDLVNAKLDGKLDLTVGKHTATFKSDEGHLFADGKDVKTVDYTIAGILSAAKCGGLDGDTGADSGSMLPLIGGGIAGAIALGLGFGGFLLWRRRRVAQS